MTLPPPRPQFAELLRALVGGSVDFVVVGGAAAVLAGVWHATDDVDVVADFTPQNLERLTAVLRDLEARYFDPAGRIVIPDPARLASFRLNLLVTRLGRLDVLRTVGRERSYRDLVESSTVVDLGGFQVRSLDLPMLIEAKEVAGRDKDHDHLRLLREAERLRRLRDAP